MSITDLQELKEKIEEEVKRYKLRLIEELENGIILDKISPPLSDYELNDNLIKLMKGVTQSPTIATYTVIGPFLKLCNNFITQDQKDLQNVWETCCDYLTEQLEKYENLSYNATPIQKSILTPIEVMRRLNEDNPLQYCVERKFHGAKMDILQSIELPNLENYDERDYYCNEIFYEIEDNDLNSLLQKQRISFNEVIKALIDLCILLPQSMTKKEDIDFKVGE